MAAKKVSNKRVLLVGAAALDKSPYLQSYINLYEENEFSYDILCWNRLGE